MTAITGLAYMYTQTNFQSNEEEVIASLIVSKKDIKRLIENVESVLGKEIYFVAQDSRKNIMTECAQKITIAPETVDEPVKNSSASISDSHLKYTIMPYNEIHNLHRNNQKMSFRLKK